jgi:alkaline phosphatase
MERLPVMGMMRTWSANTLTTDSAAAATAIASGVKTKNGMIGLTPQGESCKTILECLRQKGWRSGLVATSQITHATPAGFAAHVGNRNHQAEIASQMLANRVDVMFGGGALYWLPNSAGGSRSDRRDLLDEALQRGYQIARTREQMMDLNNGPAIGLFADKGMTTIAPEPTLEEMTRKAIEMLSSQGQDWFAPKPRFFLMIEGSQIDWAAHSNETDNVIRQTLLFDMAVRRAVEFAQQDKQTLVIVTADHETGGLVLKTRALNNDAISANWTSKQHTAGDVPIYAFGPGSDSFAGVIDNTDIALRLAELCGVSPFPALYSDKQNQAAVNK